MKKLTTTKLKYDYILLGGEKQSAISFVFAYPHEKHLLITDKSVVDGWDIPELNFRFHPVNSLNRLNELLEGCFVSLSNRYTVTSVSNLYTFNQNSCFETLSGVYLNFPEIKLNISKRYEDIHSPEIIVKGDLWHKPDAVEVLKKEEPFRTEDTFGCKYFFQQYIPEARTLLSFGKNQLGKNHFGVFNILSESNAREDYILAAETIQNEEIEKYTIEIVNKLNISGFYSFNWIKDKNDNIYLTSLRNEPKALFTTLKNAGVDLMNQDNIPVKVANSGLKMIGEIHYSSYTNLCP